MPSLSQSAFIWFYNNGDFPGNYEAIRGEARIYNLLGNHPRIAECLSRGQTGDACMLLAAGSFIAQCWNYSCNANPSTKGSIRTLWQKDLGASILYSPFNYNRWVLSAAAQAGPTTSIPVLCNFFAAVQELV